MVVANPIYDIVFKFLMEDERIARTILGALLQKNITHVEMRPHEYSNDKREKLSVYRIDFGATVCEADGTEHIILVELQKTWLPTETLRFRQYLGVQYEDPRNIVEDSADGHALPMVCVYLLGHNVGDIEEPVLYVRHRSFDYQGQPVTKGLPNAFVDSLTHDSIIVQIPRLHGRVNARLYEVLSIFDQSRTSERSQQMLDIDDNFYPEDDVEMQRIVRRLLMAAADPDMRMDMNVEDEYFSLIEKQDTDILIKTRELAEMNVKLAENQKQLQENQKQLQESRTQLQESQTQLQESQTQLQESQTQLQESQAQLMEKESVLRASIQMLHKAGLSADSIAQQLHQDLETIRQMLDD